MGRGSATRTGATTAPCSVPAGLPLSRGVRRVPGWRHERGGQQALGRARAARAWQTTASARPSRAAGHQRGGRQTLGRRLVRLRGRRALRREVRRVPARTRRATSSQWNSTTSRLGSAARTSVRRSASPARPERRRWRRRPVEGVARCVCAHLDPRARAGGEKAELVVHACVERLRVLFRKKIRGDLQAPSRT